MFISGAGRSVYSVAACDPPIMAAAASIAVARCGVLIGVGGSDSCMMTSIPSARAWSISSCAPGGRRPDPVMISGMAAFSVNSEEDEQVGDGKRAKAILRQACAGHRLPLPCLGR